MKEQRVELKINKSYNNSTLYEYLLSYRVNGKFINNLINQGKVVLNGQVIKRNNTLLKENDIVCLSLMIENIKPYNTKIKILYEDEWVIAVNKPQGILVHSDGCTSETLMNAVYYYLFQTKQTSCAYPIHRIDYDTTGIVIFAKNKLALSFLSVAIEKHEIEKEYVCLCEGLFEKKEGVIDYPIGKDRHSNKQIVVMSGKEAKTYYKVVEQGKESKIRVKIVHGRKHQIRVHMAYIKHPIVGDKIYGHPSDKTLKLHFCHVRFIHPYTKEVMNIFCKEDF